jgi:hypothetical protein
MEIDRKIQDAEAKGNVKEIRGLERMRKNERRKLYAARLKKFLLEQYCHPERWRIPTH